MQRNDEVTPTTEAHRNYRQMGHRWIHGGDYLLRLSRLLARFISFLSFPLTCRYFLVPLFEQVINKPV